LSGRDGEGLVVGRPVVGSPGAGWIEGPPGAGRVDGLLGAGCVDGWPGAGLVDGLLGTGWVDGWPGLGRTVAGGRTTGFTPGRAIPGRL